MVRQYIGARYVTKIYENSLTPGSAEWESGVEYEPLTMVTYLNSSYLSKKLVPISIGNPPSNPEYWVQTGFYNGQISNLQNQIDNLQNTINAILAEMGNIHYVDTVSDIASLDAQVGDIVETSGYYIKNGTGSARYTVDSTAKYNNSYMSIPLTSGLYANLIVVDNELLANTVGCKPYDNAFDNAIVVNEIVTDSTFNHYKLIFGSGRYYFNSTVTDNQSVDLIGQYCNSYNTDQLNNTTTLYFTGVSSDNTAIKFTENGCIKNLFIFGEFVTVVEDRTRIGEGGAITTNWLIFTTNQNVIAIDCRNPIDNYTVTIENCCIKGFYVGVYMAFWSKLDGCTLDTISNTAIYMANDCEISNCRINRSNAGILTANLAIISNVRADSIRETFIIVGGKGNVINNIVGDYCGRNCIGIGGASVSAGTLINNITGRCGINYVGVAYSTLTGDDVQYCAVISTYNSRHVNILNLDGRSRVLDNNTPITAKPIAMFGTRGAYVVITSELNAKPSASNLANYIDCKNAVSAEVKIGQYSFIYTSSSDASANVSTPTLEAVT